MIKLRLHRLAALLLVAFILLHLLNHLVALAGVEQHLFWMEELRKIYRHPLLEFMLLLAVGMQVCTGVGLFFRKRERLYTFYEQLQRWSGAYLALFLLFHLAAVFTGRLVLEV
ncbi:MAG: hypothetical protein AAGA62_19065, partial [Bacteroidota bacterium]